MSAFDAPTYVYLDERVARSMRTQKDDELAERGIEQIRYIQEDKVKELLREVDLPEEIIVQIIPTDEGIIGLSTHAKLYLLNQDAESRRWELFAPALGS